MRIISSKSFLFRYVRVRSHCACVLFHYLRCRLVQENRQNSRKWIIFHRWRFILHNFLCHARRPTSHLRDRSKGGSRRRFATNGGACIVRQHAVLSYHMLSLFAEPHERNRTKRRPTKAVTTIAKRYGRKLRLPRALPLVFSSSLHVDWGTSVLLLLLHAGHGRPPDKSERRSDDRSVSLPNVPKSVVYKSMDAAEGR